MGTDWKLEFRDPPDRTLSIQAVDSLFQDTLRTYDLTFSDWSPSSELRKLEALGLSKWHEPSALFLRGLRLARDAYEQSKGHFDITIGAVIWKEALKPLGTDRLLILGESFRFRRDPRRLSFGGLAKGMAVGALATSLHEAGIRDFLIDGGGGNLARAGAFRLQITENQTIEFISNSAARQNGKQHIFDPLAPLKSLNGNASIVCRASELERSEWERLSGLADAYSTTLVIDSKFKLPPGCSNLTQSVSARFVNHERNLAQADDPWRHFDTLLWDGVPWRREKTPERVVAIGDIHGDLDALVAILKKNELIDDSGHWAGGAAELVFTGDLVDRGPDSALVLEMVDRLRREAPTRGGGHVNVLLGNHELMALSGDHRYVSPEDAQNMRKFLSERGWKKLDSLSDAQVVKEFYGPHGPFTETLRNQNSILKIGDTLFTHAGLEGWALDRDPGRINATLRAQLRYLTGDGPQPPLKTRWVLGTSDARFGFRSEGGPLWTRVFAPQLREGRAVRVAGGPTREELEEILHAWGAQRVVVGHTPQDHLLLAHPYYGEHVLMIDTGISRAYGGPIMALDIRQGYARAVRTARPRASLSALTQLRAELFKVATATLPASRMAPLTAACARDLASLTHSD